MKEKGQIFTIDMVFALLLVATFITISSQAYTIASGNMREYSSRLSLERQVDDISNALVKTRGEPTDWDKHTENLEMVGLAEVGKDNQTLWNYLNPRKLGVLASQLYKDNLEGNEPSDEAIREFFGTTNFEIRIIRDGKIYANFWPGWSGGKTSPAEKATDVAVASRIVFGRMTNIAGESPPLARVTGGSVVDNAENIEFWLNPGDLDSYDWYVYIDNVKPLDGITQKIEVTVNKTANEPEDYTFKTKKGHVPGAMPLENGGMENDTDEIDNEEQLRENELNFIEIKYVGNPSPELIRVYIVGLPDGEDRGKIGEMIKEEPYILQVRYWR